MRLEAVLRADTQDLLVFRRNVRRPQVKHMAVDMFSFLLHQQRRTYAAPKEFAGEISYVAPLPVNVGYPLDDLHTRFEASP